MPVIEKEKEAVQAQLSHWIKSDARRIAILAELIVAIPLSRSVQSGDLAEKIIRKVQDQSIQQMLRRFYKNEAITWEVFYAPLIEEVLKNLEMEVYYLVMDTTKVGAKHRAVTLSLVYQKRCIPLVWQIEKGCKGHSQEKVQVDLLQQLYPYLQTESPVIFLGDTEFDGILVQKQLRAQGWFYVIRTSPKLYIYPDQEAPGIQLASLVPQVNDPAQTYRQVYFTSKYQFGPVDCFACWEDPYDEPLILLAHLPPNWALSIRQTYKPRFYTEPLFGDCKEAGFRLSQSKLTLPDRLSRLFLATCASYLWMLCLGSQVLVEENLAQVDRSNRRTLSIFKLGWRWFKRQLKFGLLVPFSLDFSFSFVLPLLKFT
jgi:hypothetical protein